MPNFTCDKCMQTFARKSTYDFHINRKNPCAKVDVGKIIKDKVAEGIKEVSRQANPYAELSLSDDETQKKKQLQGFYENLHNLLWNRSGLSPESSLEHMIFFFAYRLIEDQADTLNLKKECRWSYMSSMSNENDMFEIIKKGCTEFRKNSITKQFFKQPEIEKADIIYDIVKQIGRIPLSALHNTDVLGDIFEYMLERGMSTMSDEGQYFTNRKICQLAFDLAYKIKGTVRRKDGTLCTFADWFCGTGGFPAEYVKGVTQKAMESGHPVDWKLEYSAIYCQDMTVRSVTTTLLNMLILTGVAFGSKNIHGGNSFVDPITMGNSAPHKGLEIDYCFMNPPYGGDKTKGIDFKFTYAKGNGDAKKFMVNAEIQSIGIEDDDKVSAGVQLAMATLSTYGGICCIVLWEQFFFSASNKKCVELRKKIAEEYKIHYVVNIPSGAFLNTSTKTSMIVFQKGVGATEKVSFIGLDEEVLVEATLAELRAKNYLLDYKKYLPQSSVEVEGFEMVNLGDVVSFKAEKSKKDKSYYTYIDIGSVNKGNFKAGDTIAKDDLPGRAQYSVKVGDVLLGTVRPNLEHYLLISPQVYREDLIVSNGFSIMRCDTDKILPRYLYSILTLPSTTAYLTERATGTTYPVIDDSIIGAMEIPLPSLERQAQIVEAIDGWATLAQQEEIALKILEKQMMFQVKEMGRGKERVKLGEVIKKVKSGKTNSTEASGSGEYDFYGCTAKVPTNTHSSYDFEGDEYLLFAKSGGNAKTKVGENLGIGKFHYVTGKTAGNIAVFQYNVNGTIATCQFTYYLLKTKLEEIQLLADYTTGNGNINIQLMYNTIELQLPSLTEQQTLQSDFDEIRHKHAKIAYYKAKADDAIKRLIPGAD
jgi:type I restriction-modification system DNA methylase subunit/restriction endonuclease S subunit